jgi:hypothetical protein
MTRRIASIYFMAVKADRPLYGGHYELPAVPRNADPAILVVEDKIQWEQQLHVQGGGKIPRQINGTDIANDIVNEWSRNALGMSGDCGPGIWLIRDVVPEINADGTPVLDVYKKAVFRAATEQEKAAMWKEDVANARARQQAWGDYLIRQGDLYDKEPKTRALIRDLHREACKYYGREREWLQELRDGDVKYCPFCMKALKAEAVKCEFCGEIVDREKYEELTGKKRAVQPPLKQTA